MPKLLFVTTSSFYPESSGGGQKSSTYLFEMLCKVGWQVEVVCTTSLRSSFFRSACLRLKPSRVVTDRGLGYPVRRWVRKLGNVQQRSQWFDRYLDSYQPDVVIGQNIPECPLLTHALSRGFLSFFFVRSVTCFETGSKLPKGLHPIANSPFASIVCEKYSSEKVPLVLPFVDLDRYAVEKRNREYITLINPIPQKGVEVATDIARRLPDKKFLFVKGKWSTYTQKQIEEILKPAYSLPNIEIWDYQSDMRNVYQVTDILLVPSQFAETFGRVIVEAQANRIPVIASKVGGIPFTIGEGGSIVEPKDCLEAYVEAIKRLEDEGFYQRMSDLAYQNSQRLEFDPQQQVNNFITAVESRMTRAQSVKTA